MDGLTNRRIQGILQSPRSSFESSRPPSPDSAYSDRPLSDRDRRAISYRDRHTTNRQNDWVPLSKTPKRLVKSSSEDFEENLPELKLRKGFTRLCTLDTSTYIKSNYGENRTVEGLRRSHSVTSIRKFDENGKINYETSDFENLKKIIWEGIKSENRQLIKFALLFASDEDMRHICEKFSIEKLENSLISHVIVEEIKIKFQAFIKNKCDVLRIWVGRQDKQHYGIDTIVIVINPPKPSDLGCTFWGLHLLVRCANECSNEASSLLIHDVYDSASTLSVQIKDSYINSFCSKHSNISLINTSSVCSIGYSSHSLNNRSRIERIPSIVIYCHVKGVTPIGEEAFPTELDGHRIDVREAVCTFAVNPVQMSQEIKRKI